MQPLSATTIQGQQQCSLDSTQWDNTSPPPPAPLPHFPEELPITFLKLDLNDFVLTLEHEYYHHLAAGAGAGAVLQCEHKSSSSSSSAIPLYKSEWQKTFNMSQSLLRQQSAELNIIQEHHMQGKQHANNCSPTNTCCLTGGKIVPVYSKETKSSNLKRIQKKRNFQRIFHTIPPRNSCSEKKSGLWKFHLMDTDEKEEQLILYKFHIYSGKNK